MTETGKPTTLYPGRMTVWVEEPPDGTNPSWTFPSVDVELSPELIDFCGLKNGLEKLAIELTKKYPKYQGVVIQSLGVSFAHFSRKNQR